MLFSKYRLCLSLVMALLLALQVWAKAPQKGWDNDGQTWTFSKKISLTLPEKLKGSVEDEGVLLSVDDKSNKFWTGFAYSDDEKTANKFLNSMKKHLKGMGELKLGKTQKLSDQDAKLHLKCKVGTAVIDKVEFYVAMGYYTDKNEYLSFMIFYPSAQEKKFGPRVSKMLNTLHF